MAKEAVAVLDFGGQYAHLIATKLRRKGIYAEILDPEEKTEKLKEYRGIIMSGSPALSALDEESAYNKELFKLDVPILGLCFGHQEIAKYYGGKVEHREREYGKTTLIIKENSGIFEGLAKEEIVWMSHGDSVIGISDQFSEIGSSVAGGIAHSNAAIGSERLKRYGFQFHPEVDDSVNGEKMLYNFAVRICGISPLWKISSYKDELMRQIKDEAGGKEVFLLASGGVDSTVCAALLVRALGAEKVHLLHIDNGLMRKNESKEVMEVFEKFGFKNNLHFVDAGETFLKALKGAVEPEEKRKIIGETFIKVFEEQSKELSLEKCLLGQGTIYPDRIETKGTKKADLIKTHHNRIPLISKMIEEGKVIEPLKDLYKVEVRELGEALGLPRSLVWRRPFPGPGLGVRLLCSDGKEREAETKGKAQKKIDDIMKGKDFMAAVLPIKSVGVKGDLRAYDFPVVLFGEIDYSKIEDFASKIFQIAPETNRCAVLLNSDRIEDVSIIKAGVTKERLDLLREIDAIVTDVLRKEDYYEKIWQCPTVFLPLSVNEKGKEFVVIRPVYSERAMTARPSLLDDNVRREIAERIMAFDEISGAALDITTKPPGTIEWE